MRRCGCRRARWGWLVLLRLALFARPALGEGEQPAATQFVVRPWAYEKLRAAHEHIAKREHDAALRVLAQLERKRPNDHEQALIHQARSHLFATTERYAEAAQQLEQMLALEALPAATQLQSRYLLGQLYLALQRYEPAATVLSQWLTEAQNPSAQALYTLAVACTQAKRHADAVQHLRAAIQREGKPPDSWLQLLLALRIELKQPAEAARVLEQLIDRHPRNKTYWLQLASLHEEQGHPERAVAVLELAHRSKLLDRPAEIVNLVQWLVYQGAPAKGAHLLEQALQAGQVPRDAAALQLLATAWLQARERQKALGPLGELAAQEPTGNGFARLAQIRLELEQWDEAVPALRRALAKGQLNNPGQTWVLLGTALAHLGQLAEAKAAFAQARAHPPTTRVAEHWLKYVAQREQRQAGGVAGAP